MGPDTPEPRPSPRPSRTRRPGWYWPAVLTLCVLTWGLGVVLTLLGAQSDDRGTTIAGLILVGLGLGASVVTALVGRR